MNRRIGFFVGAAVVCFVLTPVLDPKFRWVPEWLGVLYAVLAVLSALEIWGRRRL